MLPLILVLAINAQSMRQESSQNPAAEEHIRRLIQALPVDSKVRHELESGRHGDGLHYSWMDAMRHAGVKRAKVIVEFKVSSWRLRSKEMKINRTLYFDKYDTDCAQITDASRLRLIQASGLEQELERFAMLKTEKTPWHSIDGGLGHPKRGSNQVEFFDDEWVPHITSFLIPAPEPPLSDLANAVSLGDEMRVTEILTTGRLAPAELDRALMLASGTIDDSCLVNLLLKAGANPNGRSPNGQTPLLYAARGGYIHNVQALLESGADLDGRNSFGQTATTEAQRRGQTAVVRLLELAKTKRP